jgi:hypothetical protein
MSGSNGIPESVSVSEDWQIDESDAKPPSLVVQLRRSALVLPWFRFFFAQGDDANILVAFATHRVVITGHGLAPLLWAISTARVVRVIEPTENEAKFGVRGAGSMKYSGPSITSIGVQEAQ